MLRDSINHFNVIATDVVVVGVKLTNTAVGALVKKLRRYVTVSIAPLIAALIAALTAALILTFEPTFKSHIHTDSNKYELKYITNSNIELVIAQLSHTNPGHICAIVVESP